MVPGVVGALEKGICLHGSCQDAAVLTTHAVSHTGRGSLVPWCSSDWQCKHLTTSCSSRGHDKGLGDIWHTQLGTGRVVWRRNTLTGDIFTHSSCRMITANTNMRSEREQNIKQNSGGPCCCKKNTSAIGVRKAHTPSPPFLSLHFKWAQCITCPAHSSPGAYGHSLEQTGLGWEEAVMFGL